MFNHLHSVLSLIKTRTHSQFFSFITDPIYMFNHLHSVCAASAHREHFARVAARPLQRRCRLNHRRPKRRMSAIYNYGMAIGVQLRNQHTQSYKSLKVRGIPPGDSLMGDPKRDPGELLRGSFGEPPGSSQG